MVYTLKFMAKREGKDFRMMSLESLWWWAYTTLDPSEIPPKEEWNWKSMIRVPDFLSEEMVEEAKKEAMRRKRIKELEEVTLKFYEEGLSAQILHIGPYSEEKETIRKLHSFIAEKGYEVWGHHHEIYLSDPRHTPPERLRTILRQPIKRKRET